jgi:hypothetical protein
MLLMEVEGGIGHEIWPWVIAHWINHVHYAYVALAFTHVPDARPHGGGALQIMYILVDHARTSRWGFEVRSSILPFYSES